MATSGTEKTDALQLEITNAFSEKKGHGHNTHSAELSWLYSQCSKSREEGLFQLYTGDMTKVSIHDKQTFFQWKSMMEFERFTHPLRQRRRTIVIQPLAHSEASSGYTHKEINPLILTNLCKLCEAFFSGMVVKLAPAIDLTQIKNLTKRVHKDTNREQFLVGDILKFLHSHRPREAYCVVGVTIADLYPSPEWNFVLGEASMNMGCGVFTFGRYFNSQVANGDTATSGDGVKGVRGVEEVRGGGGDITEQLWNMWILMRVMTHELCHIFGLKHCYYFKCSMNDSSTIQEAASQPLFLCPVCLKKLHKMIKFDLFQRYTHLHRVIQELYECVEEAIRVRTSCEAIQPQSLASMAAQTVPKEESDSQQHQGVTSNSLRTENEQHLKFFEEAVQWLVKAESTLKEHKENWTK